MVLTHSETVPYDEVFSAAYDELRRLAQRLRRGRGALALNPTALVHEAYIKLASSKRLHAVSAEHMKYIVVQAMKHILLDAARRQAAACRGGGGTLKTLALEDCCGQPAVDPRELLAVGLAIDELARTKQAQVQVFEFQFFGGFQVAEIAELMGIPEKKAQRLLRSARASLMVALDRRRNMHGHRAPASR